MLIFRLRSPLLLLLPMLMLPGCGFEAMHAKRSNSPNASAAALSRIAVEPIPGNSGQLLRAALEDRLSPVPVAASPLYRLAVKLTVRESPIGVAPDGSVSRYNVHLTAQYALNDAKDGKPLYKGTARRVTSYNSLTNAYFSSYVSKDDATRDGIAELAEDCRLQLSAYLAGNALAQAVP